MRTERDVIGEIQLEDTVFYGINTARAKENFRITGLTSDSDHIVSIAQIKKAAAMANAEAGALDKEKAEFIEKACDEIISGRYHDQFVIDVYQAGAGTSFNMNANEVIANVALTLMGKNKGDYSVIHPNDHVNMSQSTNDVYPTMMRLTVTKKVKKLKEAISDLIESLEKKSKELRGIPKPGRTHLQDAAPVTVGLEFSAYAYAIKKDRDEITDALDYIMELNIGGTAVGTGINTSKNYQENVVKHIAEITRENFRKSSNLMGIMQFMTDFSRVMNAVTNLALDIEKIANDIRLLYSGPGTGIHEIIIPAVQQGSSIMPGKINPSIAEAMNMICHSVIGAQQAVNMSVQAGQLELNVMMPNIDYELTRSIDIMRNGLIMFKEKLIDGIKANVNTCREHLANSFGSAALLNPYLGYDNVAKIVREAVETGKSIKSLVLATGKITEEQYMKIMESGVPKD
ncbi:fumarase [Thermoplasma volcanium GSS1]|uniref:Fumarase n=1 Tax=Thermoplasma volcanium (strain ATCC 51530 / DSM 4299 / JCM 9571 / NBRC 15438 / GSS1) TaxID=273116 RepID=Q978Q5_THEVO|nr:aspartate ammonia-lyase [Thermoplasma volcanium]BAB60502.1 fumarase [Thermoplasma volcanium GSS1]